MWSSKLDKGFVRFAGSDKHPDVHVTAGRHPKTRQLVITDIQVVQPPPTAPPPPKPPAMVKKLEPQAGAVAVKRQPPKQAAPPEIVFTHHARGILSQENIDARVVEQITHKPDQKQYDDDEKVRFIGMAHGDKLHVIAKHLPKEHKWLIITVELRYKRDPDAPPLADISNFDGEPTATHPGVAFTMHALERMALRNINPNIVKSTILMPEETRPDEEGKVKFVGPGWSEGRAPHVVAKFLPEDNKWLVVSTWVRGEDDDGSLSTWEPPRKPRRSSKPTVQFTNTVRCWVGKQDDVSGRDIEQAVCHPLKSVEEEAGQIKFIGQRLRNGKSVHVIGRFIAKENKWLVITAWVAPYAAKPNTRPDTRSVYRRPAKALPTYTRSTSDAEVKAMWTTVIVVIAVLGGLGYWVLRSQMGF